MELFTAGLVTGVAALVWWELALFALVFLVIVFGTAVDRNNDRTGLKWFGFILFLGMMGLFIPLTTATALISWKTAQAVGVYLLAGLLYTMAFEIPSGVLRRRRKLAAAWAESNSKRLVAAYTASGEDKDKLVAKEHLQFFVEYENSIDTLVNLAIKPDTLELDPSLNRAYVLYSTTPWVLLWPAYALSLVFGDLLTNVAEFIFDMFQNLGNRMVRKLFANTFKA